MNASDCAATHHSPLIGIGGQEKGEYEKTLSAVQILLATACLAWSTQAAPADEGKPPKGGTFKFFDIDVHYQMSENEKKGAPLILFLHGMAFTSDIWVKLGTLQKASMFGYTAMAIDLPGFGKTKNLPYVDNNMRAELIKEAIEFGSQDLGKTAILVSPSMSGKWAIPFLDRYGLMLGGWVALAPVGVSQWGGPWEFTHKQTKLLAMYGESDPMAEDSKYLEKLFWNARAITIPGAGHACYVDKPEKFHMHLVEFMSRVDPKFHVKDDALNARDL